MCGYDEIPRGTDIDEGLDPSAPSAPHGLKNHHEVAKMLVPAKDDLIHTRLYMYVYTSNGCNHKA
jgi:hypothetical protein